MSEWADGMDKEALNLGRLAGWAKRAPGRLARAPFQGAKKAWREHPYWTAAAVPSAGYLGYEALRPGKEDTAETAAAWNALPDISETIAGMDEDAGDFYTTMTKPGDSSKWGRVWNYATRGGKDIPGAWSRMQNLQRFAEGQEEAFDEMTPGQRDAWDFGQKTNYVVNKALPEGRWRYLVPLLGQAKYLQDAREGGDLAEWERNTPGISHLAKLRQGAVNLAADWIPGVDPALRFLAAPLKEGPTDLEKYEAAKRAAAEWRKVKGGGVLAGAALLALLIGGGVMAGGRR